MAKAIQQLGRICLGHFCQSASVKILIKGHVPTIVVRTISSSSHSSSGVHNFKQGSCFSFTTATATSVQIMEEQKPSSSSSAPGDVKSEGPVVNPASSTDKEAEVKKNESDPVVVVRPPKKKKMVLLLSYCGQNYLGMQRNPGTSTIEERLFDALLKSNYIDEESHKVPRTVQFQRAARTDKHVSAVRQTVSLKLPEIDIQCINDHLPDDIRVMAVKKVTKGFDAKISCDSRTYMYMAPTFAFAPVDVSATEDYRIGAEVLKELRDTLGIYLGSKNFHNFTSKRKAKDPSARRFIMSFTVSDPFLKDGLEYVILRVKGQSFMLHQIRKMIGLVIAYMRGFASKETFKRVWSHDRIDIPKAPGVGLILDHVHYDWYNGRYGKDGIHEPLQWDELQDRVEEFCQSTIYPVITRAENEGKSMFEWLGTLAFHTYDVREISVNEAGVVVSEPATFSKLGDAAYLVEKRDVVCGSDDEEEGGDDDDDDDGGRKRSGSNNQGKAEEDDDDADEQFVKKELAKKKRKLIDSMH